MFSELIFPKKYEGVKKWTLHAQMAMVSSCTAEKAPGIFSHDRGKKRSIQLTGGGKFFWNLWYFCS